MFETVLHVCLAAFPYVCEEKTFPIYDDTVTAMQCSMGIIGIQGNLAQWAEENPGYVIQRYGCRLAGQVAKA